MRYVSPADYEDVKVVGWLLLLVVFNLIMIPVVTIGGLLKVIGVW